MTIHAKWKQSCTRVQISRPDPTRPTKIVTRPDPMTIHDGKKRLYYCTMHTVQRLYPGDQQHAKDYPVILRSRRSISVASRDIALWRLSAD